MKYLDGVGLYCSKPSKDTVYKCIVCKIVKYNPKSFKEHILEKHSNILIDKIAKTYLKEELK